MTIDTAAPRTRRALLAGAWAESEPAANSTASVRVAWLVLG
jgi:hypothetical protein